MRALTLCLALLPGAVSGESLVALRTLSAGAILAPGDIGLSERAIAGALADPADAVGREARIVLYAGRPIRPQDIGPPAIIDRNQAVSLVYRHGPLTIVADGRALARGGVGDVLRVMNLESRTTVSGIVTEAGAVLITPNHGALQ